MFLRILESDDSVFDHRMLVLEVFARLCQDSYTVVELFINYDCSDEISSESGVFERIVGAINHTEGFLPMPYPAGTDKLADCDIDKLTAWIADGAPE